MLNCMLQYVRTSNYYVENIKLHEKRAKETTNNEMKHKVHPSGS